MRGLVTQRWTHLWCTVGGPAGALGERWLLLMNFKPELIKGSGTYCVQGPGPHHICDFIIVNPMTIYRMLQTREGQTQRPGDSWPCHLPNARGTAGNSGRAHVPLSWFRASSCLRKHDKGHHLEFIVPRLVKQTAMGQLREAQYLPLPCLQNCTEAQVPHLPRHVFFCASEHAQHPWEACGGTHTRTDVHREGAEAGVCSEKEKGTQVSSHRRG